MIVFENPGEIDVAAISTFGVSVKDGDNPIGFFGTGLKYAIAILLRNNHSVTIMSGLDRFEFDTEAAIIRGANFDIVRMNGERLGFTTQVGKTWQIWMAYRELFCNARDEHGDAVHLNSLPAPEAGRTHVIVKGDEIEAVHSQRWEYFIEDEPDTEHDDMQIWRRTSRGFFYRGVRVMEYTRPALHTYNKTQLVQLTEDRIVKDQYMVPVYVAHAILASTDKGVIESALTAQEEWLEYHLDFHGWSVPVSDEFYGVVEKLVEAGNTKFNKTARRLWDERFPESFQPKEISLTAVQRKTLSRALGFCAKIGFAVDDTYPVKVVEGLGPQILGMAKNETIFVSEDAFHLGGAKQVASVLIEEYVHLKHGYKDETRDMQNWLFDRMVSLGEELVGEPL